MPLRRDEMCSAANSGSARPSRLHRLIVIGARGFAPCCGLRQRYLAAAADALDLAVQCRSLAVDRIVGITQVFLRRHVARARLPVADRGFAHWLGLACSA